MRTAVLSLPLLALALQFPAAAGAGEGLVDASDPERIAGIMRAEGFQAKLERDDDGDPVIRSRASRKRFSVSFYGCDKGRACKTIQFWSGFDLERGVTLARVNQWNTEKRFTKVYRDDEDDPYLEMDASLVGGVSRENFVDTLDWWIVGLDEFIEFINWR